MIKEGVNKEEAEKIAARMKEAAQKSLSTNLRKYKKSASARMRSFFVSARELRSRRIFREIFTP